MKTDIRKEIEVGQGTTATIKDAVLTIKGPKGEVSRDFTYPTVDIVVEEGKVVLKADKATKREKTILSSFAAHVKNMIKGVNELHTYKLKICSGHFPMNVSISGNDVIIKNFFGENVPRKTNLPVGADVKVAGDEITITSPDKELAGRAAAKIENLCRITNRDIRIFQDGCYITHKAGKDI